MRTTVLLVTLLLLSPFALAQTPNIQAGEWEMTSTTSFPGTPMPEQSETVLECLTEEEIQEGLAMDMDIEGCEMQSQDIRRDGMDYTLFCEQVDGMQMQMNASFRFMGDRTEGRIDAQMETPMGPMEMQVEMSGHRVGDC